ncbi:uncharacterized protein CTRU02_211813 [Colletotrichum truncatum]|uniref:Uncharacterized protein n=1 Tax=Colletotrichum truncatum TaxID=5467 RepID=A0ACC3YLR0_COLTU|nr:uncharacterized protein CTRU02_07221 [Colletotrichum truncatum]KAF6791459.1 hypothetical protein CTRU02_07221 [Colletotrichum truncatum]
MNPARTARKALPRHAPLPSARPTSAALHAAKWHSRPYSQEAKQAAPTSSPNPKQQGGDKGGIKLSFRSVPASRKNPTAEIAGQEPTVEDTFRKLLRQPKPSPDYLYSQKALDRIGKCLMFGCDAEQTAEAARLVRVIAEEWPRLQMSRSNAAIDPEAVYLDRIDLQKKNSDWEPESSTFGAIPRLFPLPQMAEKAALRFLDYIVATATPNAQAQWQQLQKQQRKAWRLESHNIRPPLPPLVLRSVTYPTLMPQRWVRSSQNVAAYTRVESLDEFSDRVRFILRVAIWSRKTNSLIAEAQLKMVFRPAGGADSTQWFRKELVRMLNFQSPETLRRYRELMSGIANLEAKTWNSKDAVEDFGSASPAKAT